MTGFTQPAWAGAERLGVMGGTFDPIHFGHLAVAVQVIGCAALDRVLLVPSGTPPHRGPALAAPADRLEMCRIAAESDPRLEVSDLELRRDGPSYTVDTLRALQRERPGALLHLVLGWDAARELHSWHQPRLVLELARLVIVGRPGLAIPDDDGLREAGIPLDGASVCRQPTPDIHATEVRRLAAAGQPLDGLTLPAVAQYIREHGLYRAHEA